MSECQPSTSAQHQCDICHKIFSKERYFRRHCRLVHVEHQRATCQFCNKQICECQASTSAQHQCDTCHKTFSKERYLRRHCRLVHVEDQRATCQFCNKQICKSNLKRHEDLVHREIKTYTCNDCQTQYGTKEQLDSHKRKEHYLPKLHCNYCNKSFTYISNLRQHNKICASNPGKPKKQFKCTKCRKIFMSGRYLRAHVKNIHEEGQKAICDVCGEEFATKASLTRHTDRKHKDTTQ